MYYSNKRIETSTNAYFFFHRQTSYYKLTIVYNLFHLVLANDLPFWGSTNLTGLPGTSTDNTLVHSSLYAIIHLKVELRKLVILVGGGFLDISKR